MRKTNLLLGAGLALLLSVNFAEAQTRTANWILTWVDTNSGAAQETGIEIFSGSTATGTFTSLAKTAADVVTYTHTVAADPGDTTICFRVRAFNAVGNSPMSNTACATSPVIQVAPNQINVSVSVTVTVGP